jgi:2-dehydropantoate 2-reductase
MDMKIAIIGTGGVGGYFGGKLANAGNDVTFLARGEHLNSIQKNGLLIKSFQGDIRINPIKATGKMEDLGSPDLIVLGIKAWQIKEVAKALPQIMHDNSIILPLQNGISAAEELKEFINPANIVGGLCRIISKIGSPGIIHHMGVDPILTLGELDNSKTTRVQRLKEIFDMSGVNARLADDIYTELWKKFISICAGGLLAVTRSTYGEIRELAPTRNMMIGLLREIYGLSQKAGIKIDPEFVDSAVSLIDLFPYDSSSSLARDVWEGKPSEIEYQNGTVVRLGEEFGFETPINRFIYYTILPMEIRARKKGQPITLGYSL